MELDAYIPIQDDKYNEARRRLQQQLWRSDDVRQKVVEQVEALDIKDFLQFPAACSIHMNEDGSFLSFSPLHTPMRICNYAVGQMCERIGYFPSYMTKVLEDPKLRCDKQTRREKVSRDINWHLQHAKVTDKTRKDGKFMLRYVDNVIRAVVSSSFKRHLKSEPMLEAFLQACDHTGLKPYSHNCNSIRLRLNCMDTEVYDAGGELVSIGNYWSTSDFGAGSLKVGGMLIHAHSGVSYPLHDTLSAIHVGPVIDSDEVSLSQETMQLEIQTQQSGIRDAVQHTMSPNNIRNILDAVAWAKKEQLTWHQIRSELGAILTKKEYAKLKDVVSGADTLEMLPPVYTAPKQVDCNRLWVAQILATFADKRDDEDARDKLTTAAGNILVGKSKGDVKQRAA
jgi:hypothetical protein